ncbi:hypothetical protein M436DRAFT_50798, partial [Aureobasidium namibiae CBS 147.97]
DGSTSTYGHSQLKTGHPVRSAIHKQLNGRLVLRWVTTWESLLLYVLFRVTHNEMHLSPVGIDILSCCNSFWPKIGRHCSGQRTRLRNRASFMLEILSRPAESPVEQCAVGLRA